MFLVFMSNKQTEKREKKKNSCAAVSNVHCAKLNKEKAYLKAESAEDLLSCKREKKRAFTYFVRAPRFRQRYRKERKKKKQYKT